MAEVLQIVMQFVLIFIIHTLKCSEWWAIKPNKKKNGQEAWEGKRQLTNRHVMRTVFFFGAHLASIEFIHVAWNVDFWLNLLLFHYTGCILKNVSKALVSLYAPHVIDKHVYIY